MPLKVVSVASILLDWVDRVRGVENASYDALSDRSSTVGRFNHKNLV
jgi:hypothetical protein